MVEEIWAHGLVDANGSLVVLLHASCGIPSAIFILNSVIYVTATVMPYLQAPRRAQESRQEAAGWRNVFHEI